MLWNNKNPSCSGMLQDGYVETTVKLVVSNYLRRRSSETVSFQRPCLRRRANTLRPFLEAMRSRKPNLFLRERRDG